MSNYKCGAASHTGKASKVPLDHFFADPDLGLWLVSDSSVRGRSNGHDASKVVIESITSEVKAGNELVSAIKRTHQNIVSGSARDAPMHGMTATIVAAREIEGRLELAWVGNSRVYLYDMSTPDVLRQLSTDHSYNQLLVDTGTFSMDDLTLKQNQNVLTVSIGADEIKELNADHMQQQIGLTQKIILCSDGLNKGLSDHEIAQIMSRSYSSESNAKQLVEAAMAKGGSDDVTVIVISRA